MSSPLLEFEGGSVGPSRPSFIVAEAGVNHNGDLGLALRLVDAAAEAGADAVKFQTWVTEDLVRPGAALASYQRDALGYEIDQFEMLRRLELPRDAFRSLLVHARSRGLVFLSTPDEEQSADFLEALGVPLFKIGSGEVTNLSFLRHVARKGRAIFLSTGMSTLGEVEAAIAAIESEGNHRLCLLHCVSQYPALPVDCNLRAMDTLAQAFGYPVGFSDHTPGLEIALAAAARGARVIEKHLTLDRGLDGPDHRASLVPAELTLLVRGIRAVESALGDGVKRPTAAELETKRAVQKSVLAARSLCPGERITERDLLLRRCSGGLPPAVLPWIVGRRIACPVSEGAPIEWTMLQ
jgi:N,N'-diacetyllegionaminate synthase